MVYDKPKRSIEQVTSIAKSFLIQQGYLLYIKLDGVEFNHSNGTWKVSFDIGAITKTIKTIVVDDEDGNVISFN
ncbi:MAG: hypothetical protein HY051_03180 [Candidatus Aenigmarchaeota archaeon]|nr:hypothetical protein [Candidatus Aenigmarchaeota archaeon]